MSRAVMRARVTDQAAAKVVRLRDHADRVLGDLPADRDVDHLCRMALAILDEMLERLRMQGVEPVACEPDDPQKDPLVLDV